jgi:hypothetical protein
MIATLASRSLISQTPQLLLFCGLSCELAFWPVYRDTSLTSPSGEFLFQLAANSGPRCRQFPSRCGMRAHECDASVSDPWSTFMFRAVEIRRCAILTWFAASAAVPPPRCCSDPCSDPKHQRKSPIRNAGLSNGRAGVGLGLPFAKINAPADFQFHSNSAYPQVPDFRLL